MPAAQPARRCAADSLKAMGATTQVAKQDQPIGGRKTRALSRRIATTTERAEGWSVKPCCAANGTAWVIVATGKAQAQHAEPTLQTQSSCEASLPSCDALSSQSSPFTTTLRSAVDACWTLTTAIALAFHADRMPPRHKATISRHRMRNANGGMATCSCNPRLSIPPDSTPRNRLSTSVWHEVPPRLGVRAQEARERSIEWLS